jgi:hypothetical protein
MTTADREYAAQHLLAFLQRVGPLEAIWAMTTALEALQAPDALASGDHLATVVQAFDEVAAEANELAAAPPPEAAPNELAAAPPPEAAPADGAVAPAADIAESEKESAEAG